MPLILKGELKGHTDWVTSACAVPGQSRMLVSGSRDKRVIVWEITGEGGSYGYAKKSFGGHNGPVSDVAASPDGEFIVSVSWDKTARVWDLASSKCTKTLTGHTSDVFAAAVTNEKNIVTGGRDKTLKVWSSSSGACTHTTSQNNHGDWISAIKYSPSPKCPLFVTCGWDQTVKTWNATNNAHRSDLVGHKAVVNCVAISPDYSLCASGAKDGIVNLWDLSEGKHLYSLDAKTARDPVACVNALVFSPNLYLLVAATDRSLEVWDLEAKRIVDNVPAPSTHKSLLPWIISLCWSAETNTLFAGSTDGTIYVYEYSHE